MFERFESKEMKEECGTFVCSRCSTLVDYIRKPECPNRFYCFWHEHESIKEGNMSGTYCEFANCYLDWIPDYLCRMTNKPYGYVGIYAVLNNQLYRIYNGTLNASVIEMLNDEASMYYGNGNYNWQLLDWKDKYLKQTDKGYHIVEIGPESRRETKYETFKAAYDVLHAMVEAEMLYPCTDYKIVYDNEILYSISGPEP